MLPLSRPGISMTYLVPATVAAVVGRSTCTYEKPLAGVTLLLDNVVPGDAAVPVRTLTVTLVERRTCRQMSTALTPGRDGTNSCRKADVVSWLPGKLVELQAGSPVRV